MPVPTRIILFLCVSFFARISTLSAQTPGKEVHNREQAWLGYFNQSRFSDKWGVWVDVHYRTTGNFIDRPFQFLIRPALTYFVKDNVRINAGYAYARHFAPQGLTTARNEHRPWQQVWWSQVYPAFTTLQWLRLEERFNEKVVADVKEDGYNFNMRARYNFSFFIPLKGKQLKAGTPFAAIMNEVFLNFGNKIIYNTFDQNRFFVGAGYQFTAHLNAQVGYMNVYQQEAVGNSYFSTHTIRLFVFHSLDFRHAE